MNYEFRENLNFVRYNFRIVFIAIKCVSRAPLISGVLCEVSRDCHILLINACAVLVNLFTRVSVTCVQQILIGHERTKRPRKHRATAKVSNLFNLLYIIRLLSLK